MSRSVKNESEGRKIDLDFTSRNWLTLTRIARMGYSPKEAKHIMKKIEAGKMTLRDVKKK